MKIEDQVTSLDISKRLKELRVKQDSLFEYRLLHIGEEMVWSKPILVGTIPKKLGTADVGYGELSAFTSSELGEMLPQFVTKKGKNENRGEYWERTFTLHTYKERSVTFLRYVRAQEDGAMSKYDYSDFLHSTSGNEQDARAKMLIYLIENKLI